MAVSRPAVFFDKDGTLIEDVPYNADPALIALSPGAGECVSGLHAAGYLLFVITNQSGVARGLFTVQELQRTADTLRNSFAALGAELAGFYYCPHLRGCDCRKPEPGLLFRAAREHGVDLHHSWMVGDILEDCEAGRRAGCRTVLVRSPRPLVYDPGYPPDYTIDSLHQLTPLIVQRSTSEQKELCLDCP